MKRVIVLLLASLIVCTASAESVTKMPWTVQLDSDSSLHGEYTGDVENGVPHGYGLFSSENSDGVPWHYIGDWSNGVMHGDGLRVWESGYQENGTFRNGVFVSGTTVNEIIFPNRDIIDLPYAVAGEQVAKEYLTEDMVFVKATHGNGYVNVYVNIDKYSSKKEAIHDACVYLIDITERLYFHPDIKYIKCYYEYTPSQGKTAYALSLCWKTVDAIETDFESLRTLVDQSALAFMKQLYHYNVTYHYRDHIY